MIKLKKGQPPAVLVKNSEKWTADLLKEVAAGGDKKNLRQAKYRHPDIKKSLIEETNGKCAYCESYALHVCHGDIEHIIPKSIDINKTFEWENLTLACQVCNTGKANKEGFVDPYIDEPQEDFVFIGPMVLHKEGKAKAAITMMYLNLNRPELLSRRAERIAHLVNLFREINCHPDPDERALMLSAALENETSAAKEFAACSRSHLSPLGGYPAG